MTKIFTPAAPTTTVTSFLRNYYDGTQYDVQAHYAGEELLAEVRVALAQCDANEDEAEIKGLKKVIATIIKHEYKAGCLAHRMMRSWNAPVEYTDDEESRVFGWQS